jgi:hypothetical protein
MVTSEEAKPIDFKIYRLSIDFQVVWIYWGIRPQYTLVFHDNKTRINNLSITENINSKAKTKQ